MHKDQLVSVVFYIKLNLILHVTVLYNGDERETQPRREGERFRKESISYILDKSNLRAVSFVSGHKNMLTDMTGLKGLFSNGRCRGRGSNRN